MDKHPKNPPKLADTLLRWFCSEELIETLQGDLYELYQRRADQFGKRRADFYYFLEVIDMCRPFAWKKRSKSPTNYMGMFKNNLRLSIRSLWKNWGTSLLNLAGLTLGVLGAIIIFLTLKYETSFDGFHQNQREIYRVTNNYYYPTFTMYVGNTPDPMAKALESDFPDFKAVFSINSSYGHPISVEEQIFESDIIYCGPEFIRAFDYYNQPSQWILGDPNNILKDINKTILTKSLAEKLFRSPQNAMGKTILLGNETPLEVAGVIQDPPNNTNYPFEQLVSFPTYQQFARNSFGSVSSTTTFVQLSDKISPESLQPALNSFNEKYMEAAWGEDFVSIALQSLSDIHYDERFGSNNYTTNSTYLWALALIGIFIILIACINFINLATAKALSRSKEIAMRKILGSSKQNIIFQFMVESFLLALLGLGSGLMLAQFSFPYFSELTHLNIGNQFQYTSGLILFITGLLAFITLAIGLYPAVMLSGYHPLEIFRHKKTKVRSKLSLRKSLIVLQLTTSQVLLIGAIVISYQLQFFQNKDLGFEEESLLIVNINGNVEEEKKQSLRSQIENIPFVRTASLASTVPMGGHNSSTGLTSIDSKIKERFNVEYIYADNHYAEAMNFELLAGKAFVTPLETDTIQGFVVNETLIKRLEFGSPQEAIGKRINVHGYQSRIIGVVKDFHTHSLHEVIKPIALVYGIKDYAALSIKFRTDELRSAVASLEQSWKTSFPDKNFDYFFLDERLTNIYDNEIRFSKIINAFTLISIFIACLGLIGLSVFTSLSRMKEIGIRKVLGASIPGILLLMSREFMILTLISFFIGAPIAFYMTGAWLDNFAYRIQLEWWMILSAGVLTLFITLMTVGIQSIKAAMINPVESLRKL